MITTYPEYRACETYQIAYPVGPNEDAYYLHNSFTLDVKTNNVDVKCKAIKNFYSNHKKEVLFEGTAKECLEYINNITT